MFCRKSRRAASLVTPSPSPYILERQSQANMLPCSAACSRQECAIAKSCGRSYPSDTFHQAGKRRQDVRPGRRKRARRRPAPRLGALSGHPGKHPPTRLELRPAHRYGRLPNNTMERLMQPTTNIGSTSYSDLPSYVQTRSAPISPRPAPLPLCACAA